MATKRISIDLEAYERLCSVRRGEESLSQAIKQVIPPPLDFEGFRKRLQGLSLSKKAAVAIERQIQNRRRQNES